MTSRLEAGWRILLAIYPPTEAGGRQRSRLEAGKKTLGRLDCDCCRQGIDSRFSYSNFPVDGKNRAAKSFRNIARKKSKIKMTMNEATNASVAARPTPSAPARQ